MEFRILGPLEVREGDVRLACTGAKQRLLLGVLLLHSNEVVSNDRLIEALWGESPPETAGKALQMHVGKLRSLLEPERAHGASGHVLVTRPPGYELRVEPGQLDLHRFEQAVNDARASEEAGRVREAASTLRDALALWRGPPLADLSFEGSLQADIARLEELRLAALEDRLEADLALGRHAEVIGELESVAAEHPLRERIRGQLMLALYRSARQAEALEVYRETRRMLVDELGIEPSRRLKDLERAMLAQDPGLDLAGTDRATATSGRRPPAERLVGREPEMTKLVSLLEGALSGRGALVVVGGEPGIGKSRLADALAAHADERGARVLVGRCWEAGGAPAYWPWVQALRSYVRQADSEALRAQVGRGGAELATLLPELRELLPGVRVADAPDSADARFRLFESVASFLRDAASSQPLALFLDDLHAADAPSLLLLRFVAGQLAGVPVLVVACYRDTEIGADLRDALAELSRETAVNRLALRGLGGSDTAHLLALTMGRAPDVELAAQIHADTRGNPLFAAEIGRLLASEDWRARRRAAEGRLPIPEGVREAIGQRLRHRSEGCRALLAVASVIGREFGLDVLERAGGLGDDELVVALEEAGRARLVDEVPGASGRLRFAHVLVRDAVYEDLPTTRRLRLHREIGQALEALHARNLDPHLAELAHHYIEAGPPAAEKAIDYAARAGDRAASQLAYEEAARHYASALSLLETSGAGGALRTCELLLSAGDALSRAGSLIEAKEAFLRAAALAEPAGWSDQLARAALGYGGRFVWARAGSDTALVPLYQRALAAVGEEDSIARVRLLARLAGALRDDPSRERRATLAREAVDVARRLGDPVTLAHALDGHWPAVEGPDTAEDRIGRADELISLGEQIGDKERVFQGHDYRLHTLWTLADRAGIDVELDRLAGLADELRQAPHRWHSATTRTELALMEGRFEQAEEMIAEALALGRRAQSWNAVVSQRIALFVLRREQGRLAELEDTVRRSIHEFPALWRFRCVLAHLYAALGREREARVALDELLSHDLRREYFDEEWLFGMNLLPDVCAFLADRRAAGRLHTLLLRYERLYAETPLEATFGSIARGLGVLATVLRSFDEAEAHFEVAMETERRMGARPWLAHAQHDAAVMLRARGRAGDAQRARELLDKALGAYRRLGMETWAKRAEAIRSGSL